MEILSGRGCAELVVVHWFASCSGDRWSVSGLGYGSCGCRRVLPCGVLLGGALVRFDVWYLVKAI